MSADRDLVRGLQATALCLRYPDDQLLDLAGLLRATAAELPGEAGVALSRFVDHLETTPLAVLQQTYVDTFDLRRRCCLFLTYYSHGDTRKRGMALLRFTSAYRAGGITIVDGELPDHLGLVCEAAARVPDVVLPLLAEHRAAVELLRIALADAHSRYVDVLDLLRAVLPDPAPDDLDRALELARSGPPAEEVGLEPFAPPEYMGARR